MKHFTSTLALAGAIVVGALSVASVNAQYNPFYNDPAHTVRLTFSKPIRLPGVTLPAGTYVFTHPTPFTDQHVVQVLSGDGMRVITTLLSLPNDRMTPNDQPVVMFRETPTGSIDTVKAWYFPGDRVGDEFIYSKTEALEIAKATHESVLSESGPTRVSQ